MKMGFLKYQSFVPSSTIVRNFFILGVLGICITLAGIFIDPQRILPNILLANYYLLSLGLSGIVFIAILYVSNAGWATMIRRVPEAMTAVIPISAAVFALLFILGIHSLYEWSHESVVVNDPILKAKSGWLSGDFFTIRSFSYIVIWYFFVHVIVRNSRKQDNDAQYKHTFHNKALSAIFLIVFGFTFTLASFDWIMSLEPHWYSTIFGVYNFAGLFLNGIATMIVLIIFLRRNGVFKQHLTENSLFDLGKLLFAFSTFWMYIWFSQYILIWYANIPEETIYFVQREKPGWIIFGIVNVLFNWIIPFLVLLPAWTKKTESVLYPVAIIVMIGHWIDLFWMVVPPFQSDYPSVGIWEISPMVVAISLFFLTTIRTLAKHSIIPMNDPYIVETIDVHSTKH